MSNSICSHDRKDLVLHFYGELNEPLAHDVDARLAVCPACKEYFEGLQLVEKLVPRAPSVSPDETVMQAVRSATSSRIRELSRQELEQRAAAPVSRIFSSRGRFALAFTCLFAAFVVGRISVPEPDALPGDLPGNQLARVSDVQFDEETGLVNVQYSTERVQLISGSIDDEPIRAMLQRALSDAGNPAARLRATKLLSRSDIMPLSPNPQFIEALQHILEEESNIGIQLQAVKALRQIHAGRELPAELSITLMRHLETSVNSALRAEVLALLTESELARQELQRVLERAATDENSFIRHQARSALDELVESVPLEELN